MLSYMPTCPFVTRLEAATHTTIASGKWNDAAIWSGGNVPQNGDDAVIATGTDVTLDITTPMLTSVKIDGMLHGAADTIYVTDRFFGAGSFQPDSGTVAFYTLNPIILDPQTVPNYYNLWFADNRHQSGSRWLSRSLIVQHDLTADFRKTLGAKIDGTGSLTIGGSLIYVGDSTSWSGKILMSNLTGSKLVRLRVAPPSGAQFKGAFTFPRITIDKPDTTYLVQFGFTDSSLFQNPAVDSLIGDTLYVGTTTMFADTAVTVLSGTLDAGRGIFSCAGSIRSTNTGPFIHVASGARFRTGRVILPAHKTPYDSTFAPFFDCDSGSAFEYYGNGLRGYVDLSYTSGQLVGHHYANLWLSNGTAAGLTFDTVHVVGNLYLQFGSLLYPTLTSGPDNRQTIIIEGDVLNENRGESNSQGTGLDGDGMTAGNETWIFDKKDDTSHWTGPSEVSSIVVAPTTTLSIKFIDDAHCDSLYFVDSLEEQQPPCGGHVIGRIFTRSRRLDSDEQVSSFGGLGIRITAGSGPYPGLTRVLRTAGYAPPGIFNGNMIAHTIKRYFHVTPSDGPQTITNDRIELAYHCSEENRSQIGLLNFWRSGDNGRSWAITGINGRGLAPNSFVLDTNSLGYPNQKNAFLWALSDQQVDVALSVGLESFNVTDHQDRVDLGWSTFAEVRCLGFEITRITARDTSTISMWSNDPALRSTSRYGANYTYSDHNAPQGQITYRLQERSTDGALIKLADRTLTRDLRNSPLGVRLLNNPVTPGERVKLSLSGVVTDMQIEVFDITGRLLSSLHSPASDHATLPLKLTAGAFFVRVNSGTQLASAIGIALGR